MHFDMEKIYGADGRQDSLVKVGSSYYLYYGFGKDSDDAEHGYNYRHRFDHKPSMEEIKAVVLEAIEMDTKDRIENGLSYDGCKVTLTVENQLNYAIFKDILGEGSESLIVKVTDADGNDKAVTFSSDTYDTFYAAVRTHIKNCMQRCWKEKTELDLSVFTS